MSEALVPVLVAAAAVIVVAIVCAAALAAWRGWLELKRLELGRAIPSMHPEEDQQPATLIELASVKERLRRLEAIANGVEL